MFYSPQYEVRGVPNTGINTASRAAGQGTLLLASTNMQLGSTPQCLDSRHGPECIWRPNDPLPSPQCILIIFTFILSSGHNRKSQWNNPKCPVAKPGHLQRTHMLVNSNQNQKQRSVSFHCCCLWAWFSSKSSKLGEQVTYFTNTVNTMGGELLPDYERPSWVSDGVERTLKNCET